MRPAKLLSALALLSLACPPARAQPLSGAVQAPVAPPASSCLARYGETGCGARLYAELLCASIGRPIAIPALQQELQAQFEQAGLRLVGLTPEQLETAAVRYYAPQLCPGQAAALRELFYPSGVAAPIGPDGPRAQ